MKQRDNTHNWAWSQYWWWLFHVWLCVCLKISPVSFSADSKRPLDDTINWGCLCAYTCKTVTYTCYKIMLFMSECAGLRKHQNNPACTRSVSLETTEVGCKTGQGMLKRPPLSVPSSPSFVPVCKVRQQRNLQQQNCEPTTKPVSYTHLTLPTNHRV